MSEINPGAAGRNIFGRKPGRAAITWFHAAPRLSNQHCLYCTRYVGEGSPIPSDKEHLIGRRMPPPGGFSDPAAFNFIFRACCECNAEKAALEDHVSAVTLLTSPGRGEDPKVDEVARRKGEKSFDPRHGRKPVGEIRNNVEVKMGGVFTFNFVSAAQLDPDKVALLAFRHIQGLFALATSADPRRSDGMRLLPPEHFGFWASYPHRDWGNPELVEISRRAATIPDVVSFTTAGGYFRCALRREEPDGSPWFWALEWNGSLRLVGWVGDAETPPPVFQELPALEWRDLGQQGGARTRYRVETPLAEDEDRLFHIENPDAV